MNKSLAEIRNEMLARSTKEDRIEQTKKHIEAMDKFGKDNFPLAPNRREDDNNDGTKIH